jgi:hypothetical protein
VKKVTEQIEPAKAGKNRLPRKKGTGHKHNIKRAHKYDPRTEPREKTLQLMELVAHNNNRIVRMEYDKQGKFVGAHFE